MEREVDGTMEEEVEGIDIIEEMGEAEIGSSNEHNYYIFTLLSLVLFSLSLSSRLG